MSEPHPPGLVDAICHLWQHKLVHDPEAAIAEWRALLARHGAAAVSAAAATARNIQGLRPPLAPPDA
jgi:hypothetical protein